jgi:hypothetical protein
MDADERRLNLNHRVTAMSFPSAFIRVHPRFKCSGCSRETQTGRVIGNHEFQDYAVERTLLTRAASPGAPGPRGKRNQLAVATAIIAAHRGIAVSLASSV